MSKELLKTVIAILSFIPNVPPQVIVILNALEGVATPEEFYGKMNLLIAQSPIGENK